MSVSFTITCEEAASEQSFRDHGLGIAIAFACVALLDLPMRAVFANPKTRWFALHFLVNIAIAAICFGDLISVVAHPLCAFIEPTNSWLPSYMGFSLHFYHLTCFTALRLEDVVHHVPQKHERRTEHHAAGPGCAVLVLQ